MNYHSRCELTEHSALRILDVVCSPVGRIPLVYWCTSLNWPEHQASEELACRHVKTYSDHTYDMA